MNKKDDSVIVVGCGGLARIVVDLLQLRRIPIEGLIGLPSDLDKGGISGVPVIGTEKELETVSRNGLKPVVIAVGAKTDTVLRQRVFTRIIETRGFSTIDLVHPAAVVSASVKFGNGNVLIGNCYLGTGVTVNDGVIIHSQVSVEHGCLLSDFVHLSQGVKIAGEVRVGKGAFIGMNACVAPNIRIGDNSVVAAGSVVLSDVPNNAFVLGVPAVARNVDARK